MAVEANLNKKKEDELLPGSAQAAPPSSQLGEAAPETPEGQPRTTPTGTPNIQSYIKANMGAGQQLAQGIQGGFQKQANQFGQQVSGAQSQLNKAAAPTEQALGQQGQNLIQTSFKNPQDILKQQDQLKQFQQLRDQGYKGQIGNLNTNAQQQQTQLKSQLGNLQQTAGNANTESGRYDLLRNTFGQPNYTQGQQKLDQLFLQSQPGATQGLQKGLSGITNQAGQQLTGATAEQQAKLNALQGLSAQRAQDIKNTFLNGNGNDQNLGIKGIEGATQAQYADDQARAAQLPQILADLKANKLNNGDINSLGINDLQGQRLYNLNLGNYVNQTAPSETLSQATTQDQLGRYNALQSLAGNPTANIFGGETQTTGYDPYGLQRQKLNTDMAKAQQYYEKELPQKALEAIWGGVQDQSGTGGGYGSFRSTNSGDQYGNIRNQLVPYMNNPNTITGTQLQNIVNQDTRGLNTYDPYAQLIGQYNAARQNVIGTPALPANLNNALQPGYTLPTSKGGEVDNTGKLLPDKKV